MKTQKNYTLDLKDWKLAVVITERKGYDGWNRKPINEYLEVSCDMDREHFVVSEWHYRSLTSPDDPFARWVHNPEAYVSDASLNDARRMLEKLVSKTIPADLRKGKRHPAYKAMLSALKASGKVKHYQDDFYYHDTLSLNRDNPARFVWIIRECGTWMIKGWDNWAREILEYKDNSYECFTWDGSRLSPASRQDCIRFLQAK